MKIEITERQFSLLNSAVEQTIKTLREDKCKLSLISSLAIQSGINDFEELKNHLLYCFVNSPKERAAVVAEETKSEALVCDYCGALTPDPWHSSENGNKHYHRCDKCHEAVIDKATWRQA